ncbi:sigma-70 family RNA polymerase sigma factor [Peribacillus frigoritolerans]|uniref:RNA polymerase sigma factor n=1 Tax=Peribacillus frigoritolerans TaxID=450367 RepID=UPI002E21D6E4|nr:sigma-70 family RNA polymerase sigma factor [Peribacillus frigoritolerans]
MGELDEIYSNYAEEVFKYLMCLCHNSDLSEELTQETFYQAVKSIDRYNGECKMSKMSVWLYQIAKHSYYKHLERNKKQQRHMLQDDAIHTSPEAELIYSEDKPSTEVTEKEEKQLLTIFKKYNKKLNLLAVLPAADIEDCLQENASVKQKPTTIYPIEYNKAAIVIGNEGILRKNEPITPSGYDLGTVVNW